MSLVASSGPLGSLLQPLGVLPGSSWPSSGILGPLRCACPQDESIVRPCLDLKSMKNPEGHPRKGTQGLSWERVEGTRGLSQALGALSGASWGPLGASWAVLESFWKHRASAKRAEEGRGMPRRGPNPSGGSRSRFLASLLLWVNATYI